MKKTLLAFCLMAASFTTFAQSAFFGIKGGVNFANLVISAPGSSLTLTS